MTTKSWIVTLTPLIIALAQTVKAIITNEPLTDQEIELIKYLIGASGLFGALGVANKRLQK